jgi:hypothetical protein
VSIPDENEAREKYLEETSQVFIKMTIDPEKNKQKIYFVFSELRVIASLPTFEHLLKFSQKL